MYAVCPGNFQQFADGVVQCSEQVQVVTAQSSLIYMIDPVTAGQYIAAGSLMYIMLTVIGSPVKAVIKMFKNTD